MLSSVIEINKISKRYRIGIEQSVEDTFVGTISAVFKKPFQNLKKIRELTNFKIKIVTKTTLFGP